MSFTEDSRVKIPTILHLMRLGYEYQSLKETYWDKETNIFPDLFSSAVSHINPDISPDDVARLLDEVKLSLENEDLGRAFFQKLKARSGTRLIDFEDFSNNRFHVVTELTYKNGDDEFRPDIILLINGMPLVFIEVKKPNNRDGIIAERERINKRFRNPKFKRFANCFLELNGFDYIVQHFVREMENIAVWVADNVIDKELLHKIISSILYDDEYSIALKIEIYETVQRAEENKQQ